MKRCIGIAVAVMLLPRAALACPVCFGAADGPLLRGSNLGILALLVVTVAMLGAFGAFFATLARRASRGGGEGSRPTPTGAHPQEGGAR